MRQILILLISIVLLGACSSEERIINPQEQNSKILLSVKESPEVKIVTLPDMNIINNNIIPESIFQSLNYPITSIKEFNGNLYLSAQLDHKLIILNASSFEKVALIDFGDDNAEVGNLAFPNSTDCYLAHPNKNYISIIDITVFRAVRKVNVGQNPASLAVMGNQIVVTNSQDNTISFVDTRSRASEATLTTSPNPYFSFVTKDGTYAGVISIGHGKIDANDKSPAMLTFYNINNRSESEKLEIGEGLISANDILPVGVAITNSEWIYIATQTSLFRADARSRNDMKYIIKKNLTGIINDDGNSRIILSSESQDKNEIYLASNKTGVIQKAIKIPFKIQTMIVWR